MSREHTTICLSSQWWVGMEVRQSPGETEVIGYNLYRYCTRWFQVVVSHFMITFDSYFHRCVKDILFFVSNGVHTQYFFGRNISLTLLQGHAWQKIIGGKRRKWWWSWVNALTCSLGYCQVEAVMKPVENCRETSSFIQPKFCPHVPIATASTSS